MTQTKILFLLLIVINLSCTDNKSDEINELKGTWQLYEATLVDNGVSTTTDYTNGKSFIKIINDTHFAFILHDTSKGQDSTQIFSAGGGTYEFDGVNYTENLEYCSDRQWEGNSFEFKVEIKNDSLIQSGIEVVEEAGVNRLNIEKYVRVKK